MPRGSFAPTMALLALLAACSRRRAPPAPVASPAPSAVVVDASVPAATDAATDAHIPDAGSPDARVVATRENAADVPGREYRGRSEDEWLRLMHERPALRVLHHFSSTLHVYHLDLGDGVEVSFQPEQRGLESFWRREITSYHLARILGIEHRVPPTVGRRVPLRVLAPYAEGADLIVDAQGMVVGSASVWLPVLHGTHLWRAARRHEWGQWLHPNHAIPSPRVERARQLSEVVLFDFLSANHDRWNPGNISVDEHRDLVFRDNDGGFDPHVINHRGHPEVVRRLSRSVWERLQRATADALRDSIAHDPMAREIRLVDPAAYVGYERRRLDVIEQLRASIRRHGAREVLAWP